MPSISEMHVAYRSRLRSRLESALCVVKICMAYNYMYSRRWRQIAALLCDRHTNPLQNNTTSIHCHELKMCARTVDIPRQHLSLSVQHTQILSSAPHASTAPRATLSEPATWPQTPRDLKSCHHLKEAKAPCAHAHSWHPPSHGVSAAKPHAARSALELSCPTTKIRARSGGAMHGETTA